MYLFISLFNEIVAQIFQGLFWDVWMDRDLRNLEPRLVFKLLRAPAILRILIILFDIVKGTRSSV
jgi:hypothetical protein